jgi:hypothetical protein
VDGGREGGWQAEVADGGVGKGKGTGNREQGIARGNNMAINVGYQATPASTSSGSFGPAPVVPTIQAPTQATNYPTTLAYYGGGTSPTIGTDTTTPSSVQPELLSSVPPTASLPPGVTETDLANLLSENGGDISAAAAALGMNPAELLTIAMSTGMFGGGGGPSGGGISINPSTGALSWNPGSILTGIGNTLGGGNTLTGLTNLGILGLDVTGEIGNVLMGAQEGSILGTAGNLVNQYANLNPEDITADLQAYEAGLGPQPVGFQTPSAGMTAAEAATGYNPSALAATLNPANAAANLGLYETATGYNPAAVAAALNPANAAGEIAQYGAGVGLPQAQSQLEASLNPQTAMQQMLSYEQPLSQNLTSDVTQQTEASLAGSGLGLSPNIAQYAEAQALAPYQTQEQQLAQNMFGQQLSGEEANYQQALGLATNLYGQNVSDTLQQQEQLFGTAANLYGQNVSNQLNLAEQQLGLAGNIYGQQQSLAEQEYLNNLGLANQDVYSTLGLPISALGAVPGFPQPAGFAPFINPPSTTSNTQTVGQQSSSPVQALPGGGGGGTGTIPGTNVPISSVPPAAPNPGAPTSPGSSSTSITMIGPTGEPITLPVEGGTGMIPGTNIPISDVPPGYIYDAQSGGFVPSDYGIGYGLTGVNVPSYPGSDTGGAGPIDYGSPTDYSSGVEGGYTENYGAYGDGGGGGDTSGYYDAAA